MKRLLAVFMVFLPVAARAQDAAIAAPDGGVAQSQPEEEELPEAHRPRLGMRIDTGRGVRTGDLVHVVISADVPQGDDVTVPDQDLGSFEIFARRFGSRELPNHRRRYRFELDLLALEPGQQRLPPLRLRVVTRDGEIGTVHTSARTIRVRSRLGNEPDARPRPPTRPVPVYENDYTLAWVLGGLGALLITALIAFFAARWWTRRPKKAAPPPPARPPWEVAIEKLEAIKRQKKVLVETGKQGELVDRVSDAVREYLGHRYDFNGLESTTDEIVTRLAKIKLRRIAHADVTALLSDSDLVKFAKAVPDEAQCDRMLEGAFHIVRATTPRPDATPSTRPAGEGKGARIVTKDGEVVLPISVRSIEEAEREIGAAVGAAVRDHGSDPAFAGTIRVVLSPELRPSEAVTGALTRAHARLSSELAGMRSASGQRVAVVIEHFHDRLHTAASQGRAALRTVIDEGGARIEERPREASKAPRRSRAPSEAKGSEVSRSEGSKPPRQRTRTGPLEWEASEALPPAPSRGREGEVDASAPSREREVDASAPLPLAGGGGGKTQPALSADGASAAPTPSREREGEIPARPKRKPAREIVPREAPAGASPVLPPVRKPAKEIPARGSSIDRVVPVFSLGEEKSSGVLLRWIHGIERPVSYVDADGQPIAASALASLGLTRGGLHERALGNLRRAVPSGFAPGEEPAVLDDDGAAILLLPELVPVGDAWIAFAIRGEGLIVLREGAASTREELRRLDRARADDPSPLFTRPVRITKRGFEPLDWPSIERTTDPGFAAPDARDPNGGER